MWTSGPYKGDKVGPYYDSPLYTLSPPIPLQDIDIVVGSVGTDIWICTSLYEVRTDPPPTGPTYNWRYEYQNPLSQWKTLLFEKAEEWSGEFSYYGHVRTHPIYLPRMLSRVNLSGDKCLMVGVDDNDDLYEVFDSGTPKCTQILTAPSNPRSGFTWFDGHFLVEGELKKGYSFWW